MAFDAEPEIPPPLAQRCKDRQTRAMLNTLIHGQPTDQPPLVIAHGLYGSGRNWGVLAKRLSTERQVIAVDMRNHGHSPWFDSHSYPEMADDLAEVITAHGGHADLLGHSMGGKAAMTLALTQPHMVNRLIVADIAPVTYTHSQVQYVHAMQGLDLTRISNRAEASAALTPHVSDPTLISFFLQSLDIQNRRWRLNLDTLERDMPNVLGFPEMDGQFDRPVMMLTGANSDYVQHEHRPGIKALFPNARFFKIPGAGHWLHAEKPREFQAALQGWLSAT